MCPKSSEFELCAAIECGAATSRAQELIQEAEMNAKPETQDSVDSEQVAINSIKAMVEKANSVIEGDSNVESRDEYAEQYYTLCLQGSRRYAATYTRTGHGLNLAIRMQYPNLFPTSE